MKLDPAAGSESRPLHIRRLVVPGVTIATAIAIAAVFGTCGRQAPARYPADDRSRAALFVALCDAAVSQMGRDYAAVAPELDRLVGSDRDAAVSFLERRVAKIVAYPVESCDSARDLVNRAFHAQTQPDARLGEDAARVVMYAPRVRTAQDAYVALHAALRANQPADVRPLVDALATALR